MHVKTICKIVSIPMTELFPFAEIYAILFFFGRVALFLYSDLYYVLTYVYRPRMLCLMQAMKVLGLKSR